MNTKLELFIRVISSFIEDDGFSYFTYTNLNNVGKHDSLKNYFAALVNAGAIEDFTKNGYAKKIKINKPLDCPDFLFNESFSLLLKSYLLEQ